MVYVKNREDNEEQYRRSQQLNTTSKVKAKVMDKYDVIELSRGYLGALFLTLAHCFPNSPYFSWIWKLRELFFSI